MNYKSMTLAERRVCYQLLTELAQQVSELDRNSAGPHNALALTFALGQAEGIIESHQLELFESYPPSPC